jgi:hypothetical protein
VVGILLPTLAWANPPSPLSSDTREQTVCPGLDELLLTIARDVEDVELDRALENSAKALTSLHCQADPIDSLLLTSLLHIIGGVHLYSGDEEEARQIYAWAVTGSPETLLSASYGEEATRIYQEIQQDLLATTPASLTVTGEVEAWIDGLPLLTGTAQSLWPGRHLIQWHQAGDPMSARVIELLDGEPRLLPLGLGVALPPELKKPAPLPEPLPKELSQNRILFLSTGLTSVMGGSALVFLASRSHQAFESENDPADLPELQTRTNTLASTGLVLVASGLALGTLSFTLSRNF